MASKKQKQEVCINANEAMKLAKLIRKMHKKAEEYCIRWDRSSGIGLDIEVIVKLNDGSDSIVESITDYTTW